MRQRGFTLIEMMITVAIVGVLALGVVPLAKMGVQRMRESELRAALRDIRTGIDAYKMAYDSALIKNVVDASGYPPTLRTLVDGVEDVHDPNKKKMLYFMRRIPRDPLNPDTTLAPEDSWGLRSYASPPDDPQPGDDVYDVYTQSSKVGLDGTPYRSW
jgi:general secretion pathway protein G